MEDWRFIGNHTEAYIPSMCAGNISRICMDVIQPSPDICGPALFGVKIFEKPSHLSIWYRRSKYWKFWEIRRFIVGLQTCSAMTTANISDSPKTLKFPNYSIKVLLHNPYYPTRVWLQNVATRTSTTQQDSLHDLVYRIWRTGCSCVPINSPHLLLSKLRHYWTPRKRSTHCRDYKLAMDVIDLYRPWIASFRERSHDHLGVLKDISKVLSQQTLRQSRQEW